VRRCEVDAQMACAEAAHKMLAEPTSDDFIHTCIAKAIGAGPRWCVPHHCHDNSDCTGGTGCDVCWAGLCGVSAAASEASAVKRAIAITNKRGLFM
jgi:hypothetical protein